MNYTLKKMDKHHIAQIAQLEKLCFSHPRSQGSLEEELINSSSVFFAAVDDENKVIGYGGMNTVCDDEGYIVNIAVSPGYRKNGVGSAILEKLICFCKEHSFTFITLEVRKSNRIAISLYEKHGFSAVGLRKEFYRDPKEDAYIMTLYF